MMKLPYRPYLYYLLTKKMSYEDIAKNLKGVGLICPPQGFFDDMVDELVDKCPMPKFKTYMKSNRATALKKDPKEFMACMDKIGVKELWLTETNLKNHKTVAPYGKALSLLEQLTLKMHIECLILNKLHHNDIVQTINQRHKNSLTRQSVDAFKRIFFRIEDFSKNDWITYLLSLDVKTQKAYLAAMNEDENYLKHYLGYKTKLEFSDVLNDILATSYYRFKEDASRCRDNHANARAWGKMAMEAGEKREKVQAGSMADFTEALQLEMDFDEQEFPEYSEVLGG